jgi:uncharacterized membrane protein
MWGRYAVGYLATGIAFGLLDYFWLTRVGPGLYRPIIGELMADKPRVGPAAAFYLIYILGILFFAVIPALGEAMGWTALLRGALLGFFAYATYDLTNHATLKVWSPKITLLDMAWGTFVTGVAAWVGYLAVRTLFRN